MTAHRYQNVQLLKSCSLGIGSYGSVCKAKCDELPCAAKLLHPILFKSNDPGARRILQRFEQECHFLSNIHHPCIVQYLGVYSDPESSFPVLLMELMDESLTSFLEQSQDPLPYHTQVNLCHDIALALAYLHTNGIIHRDLSSNNVLLIAGCRAKVTDFGMSKFLNVTSLALTHCPGTYVYMPPQALKEPPVYTEKLDCFSFGVLGIQMMTRQFPNPGPARQTIEDLRYPGGIEVFILDNERRKSHIDLIDPTHPLLPISLHCLCYRENDRPSAQALCHQLAALKEASQYNQSAQQAQGRVTPEQSVSVDEMERKDQQIRELQQQHGVEAQQIQNLQYQVQVQTDQLQTQNQQLREKDRAIEMKDHMIETRERQLREVDRAIETKDHVIETKDHMIETKDRAIETRERQLREVNQRLQGNEEVTAELQQRLLQNEETLSARDQEIQVLRQQPRSKDFQAQEQGQPQPIRKKYTKEQEPSIPQPIQLSWRKEQPILAKQPGGTRWYMRRGAATTDGTVAYANSGETRMVCAYDSVIAMWSELPRCEYYNFSIVIVRGLLTVIGGETRSGQPTNKLFSLSGTGRGRKWTEEFPRMPTKRSCTAAVCSGKSLIVAGGQLTDSDRLSAVEVMDTETNTWATATSLPHPFSLASITIHGENIYLLGGNDRNGPTQAVLTTTVIALLHSCQPQSLGARLKKTLSLASTVWKKIADVPVIHSTCTTVCGQLLAVGGEDSDNKWTTAVHQYNRAANSWQVISDIPNAYFQPLVAVLPGNKLMVACQHDVYIVSVCK